MFECGCCWHVCVCAVRSDVLLSNPESINQLSWMLRLIFSDSVIEWYKWSVRSIITYSVAPRYYTRPLACTQLQLSYRRYIIMWNKASLNLDAYTLCLYTPLPPVPARRVDALAADDARRILVHRGRSSVWRRPPQRASATSAQHPSRSTVQLSKCVISRFRALQCPHTHATCFISSQSCVHWSFPCSIQIRFVL